jgi:hypothetical protein
MEEIIIYQNRTEGWVQFYKNGENHTFSTAFELIQFLQDETGSIQINLKIEQV